MTNIKNDNVYIIGPGGAGKTTSGSILSEKIKFKCIDVDHEFMLRIGNIDTFIENNGYEKYCQSNVSLFKELHEMTIEKAVMILSSGFMVYQEWVDPDYSELKKQINQTPYSILLMPSDNFELCSREIIKRQINRRLHCSYGRELEKITNRFQLYLSCGSIKVFSSGTPFEIVDLMMRKINEQIVAQMVLGDHGTIPLFADGEVNGCG